MLVIDSVLSVRVLNVGICTTQWIKKMTQSVTAQFSSAKISNDWSPWRNEDKFNRIRQTRCLVDPDDLVDFSLAQSWHSHTSVRIMMPMITRILHNAHSYMNHRSHFVWLNFYSLVWIRNCPRTKWGKMVVISRFLLLRCHFRLRLRSGHCIADHNCCVIYYELWTWHEASAVHATLSLFNHSITTALLTRNEHTQKYPDGACCNRTVRVRNRNNSNCQPQPLSSNV